MDVLIVLVFVSLVLVGGAILLFCVSLHQRDFEHAERLSLLPLIDSDRESGPGADATTACGPGDDARVSGPRGN
jgi:hypothetical protein